MSSLANAQWLKGMAQKLRGHIHTLITPGSNSQEGLAILTRRATVKDATSGGAMKSPVPALCFYEFT